MTKPELHSLLEQVGATLELLHAELTSSQDHIIEEADAENAAAKRARMPFAVALSNLQATINSLKRTQNTLSTLDETFLT